MIFFVLESVHITFFKGYDKIPSEIKFPPLKLLSIDLKEDVPTSKGPIFNHLRPFYHPVSCPSLYESDPNELKHALALLSDLKSTSLIADHHYNITKDQCLAYRRERFNEAFHREDTDVNRQFPLAFTVLMYENVEQFERLLRVIYRPQNFYCVHVDKDVSVQILEAVQSIVQCFDNVILASKQEKVLYATFSRLQADLNCMHDLMRYPAWKYLLNVANTELPLKTNSELVKILSIYRGYNDIEGRWKSKNLHRTEYVWQVLNNLPSNSQGPFLTKTEEKKKPAPGNVEIVKGSAYGMFLASFHSSSLNIHVFQEHFHEHLLSLSRPVR